MVGKAEVSIKPTWGPVVRRARGVPQAHVGSGYHFQMTALLHKRNTNTPDCPIDLAFAAEAK